MNNTDNIEKYLINISKLTVEEILKEFDTSINGLNGEAAQYRLKKYGLNIISDNKNDDIVSIFLEAFKNPLIILLIILVIVSYLINEHETSVIIFIMVLISILLTIIQESNANNAAKKLQEIISITSTVLRQINFNISEEVNISIKNIVIGDIIKLSAGQIIPADVRILESKNLYINQSSITGESLPVEKNVIDNINTDNILDIKNLCFMGSYVSSGTGLGLVILTGKNSYLGKISQIISGKKIKTSFDKGLNDFTWLIIKFMIISVPLVFIINGITKNDWIHAFLFSLAVTVALTPEMLPMIVTVNLAKGALILSKQKVIVKKLNSIQNLGAIDILCSDKTGTLTQNKVILEKHIDVNGKENEHVLKFAFLNSYYQSGLQNLLDEAIFDHIDSSISQRLIKNFKKIDELPFDFERRRLSVILEDQNNNVYIFCKGAIEEVLGICSKYEIVGTKQIFKMDDEKIKYLKSITENLNNDGFRLLAVAYKELKNKENKYDINIEYDLIIIGFIAFLDPPKDTASGAISELNRYGVEIKILTGDNDLVATKICKEVGLKIKGTILGSEIEELTMDELDKLVNNTTIFAKLSPFQKEKIIKSLKRTNIVGYLGDGINDAMALKTSDVGISVNTAVDIAKETADIILLEKNLLVLAQGVVEGRNIFCNAIKYIKSRAALNFGNMLSIVGSSIFLPFLPMLPIQIISCNLLTDFANIAIPTDNVDNEDLIHQKPWNINNIKHSMIILGLCITIFDFILFGVMIFIFKAWNNEPLFQTGWFIDYIIIQLVTLYVIRTSKITFINSFPSLQLVISHIIVILIALILIYSPIAKLINLVNLPPLYWGILPIIILLFILSSHLIKYYVVD